MVRAEPTDNRTTAIYTN